MEEVVVVQPMTEYLGLAAVEQVRAEQVLVQRRAQPSVRSRLHHGCGRQAGPRCAARQLEPALTQILPLTQTLQN
ncbi:hypothetical protein AAFF_G00026060 [Aldrovandia affinis]|uniref:Uncharacterized protein n=1 Tax=Aldrovandia affinis TaxID=143900 RepID=A0AAD7WHD0_9TELE|nr:hypothetical protein AAFF_G00026060 [Aldrovandia affinis]